MRIEIFGTGCENCRKLESNVRQALKDFSLEAEIVKIDDFEQFIRRGITATPGLSIDGRIVSLGRVPPVEEIKKMIQTRNGAVKPSSSEQKTNQGCGCSSKKTMIYSCSGGSNVGQLSNEVAKVLASEGQGKFACLAGIGAQGEKFISNAKKADTILVIDGCNSKCALGTLDKAGVKATKTFIMTDLGMSKDTSVLETKKDDVRRVAKHIQENI